MPLEENTEKGGPTLDSDTNEKIVNVVLNDGTIQDTLDTWISGALRVGVSRANMDSGDVGAGFSGRV